MVSSIIAQNSTSYGQISKPKPRPRIVEAKAEAKGLQGQGQGYKILSSRSRPVLEDPIPADIIVLLHF